MKYAPFAVIVTLLAVLLACSIEVPGGGFPPTTPTPSGPTPTPVIINVPGVESEITPLSASPTPAPLLPTAPAEVKPTAPISQSTTAPTLTAIVPASAAAPPPGTTKMVAIPAGSFTMGYDKGMDDEKPPHPVDLPEYWMDITEATNAQFAAFSQATGYQTEAEKSNASRTWRAEYTAGKDDYPVVRVSWNDAIAYCQWAGKRLPTEAEWEKAARGPDGFIYPWGNTYDPAKVNGRDSGLRTTAPVGSYPQGVSPYGLYDMAGNVREWTADPGYLPYPGNAVSSPYYGNALRVLRGGGWFDAAADLRTTRRNPTSPSAANWDIGFRCVSDKAPAGP
jgi:formylglycine-generating enzyme required for sulfatase activity